MGNSKKKKSDDRWSFSFRDDGDEEDEDIRPPTPLPPPQTEQDLLISLATDSIQSEPKLPAREIIDISQVEEPDITFSETPFTIARRLALNRKHAREEDDSVQLQQQKEKKRSESFSDNTKTVKKIKVAPPPTIPIVKLAAKPSSTLKEGFARQAQIASSRPPVPVKVKKARSSASSADVPASVAPSRTLPILKGFETVSVTSLQSPKKSSDLIPTSCPRKNSDSYRYQSPSIPSKAFVNSIPRYVPLPSTLDFIPNSSSSSPSTPNSQLKMPTFFEQNEEDSETVTTASDRGPSNYSLLSYNQPSTSDATSVSSPSSHRQSSPFYLSQVPSPNDESSTPSWTIYEDPEDPIAQPVPSPPRFRPSPSPTKFLPSSIPTPAPKPPRFRPSPPSTSTIAASWSTLKLPIPKPSSYYSSSGSTSLVERFSRPTSDSAPVRRGRMGFLPAENLSEFKTRVERNKEDGDGDVDVESVVFGT